MRKRIISTPELMLVAGARGMLGLGIGLLAADRLRKHQRHTLGTALVAIGALTSIPLALRIFRRGTLDRARLSDVRETDERRRFEAAAMMAD